MPHAKAATLDALFSDYAQAGLAGNIEGIASAYANAYVESSPSSIVGWTVDDSYRQALADRATAMTDQFGLRNQTVRIDDIRDIAPDHVLVDGHWTMTFSPAEDEFVTSKFVITYLVKFTPNPKIVAYVSHEDQEAVMKRDGMI